MARDRGAGLLDAAGHVGPAALHQRPDAVPGPAARDPRGQPDRALRADVRAAGGLGRPARRPPRRGGGERAAGARQRPGRRDQQGLAPCRRVRHHRAGPGWRQRCPSDRRQVVRRDLRRGPGPVVARRDHPLGRAVRHRPRPPRRRRGDRGSRRRPDDRHARADRRCRLRRSPARAGLDGRGRDPRDAGPGPRRDRADPRTGVVAVLGDRAPPHHRRAGGGRRRARRVGRGLRPGSAAAGRTSPLGPPRPRRRALDRGDARTCTTSS